MESKRKRKKRADSKCTHDDESLTRQWGRLYCFQCQRANWKAARDKRKLREVKKAINLSSTFWDGYA